MLYLSAEYLLKNANVVVGLPIPAVAAAPNANPEVPMVPVDPAQNEPAVAPPKEPFLRPLIVSLWIFGIYFVLARLASTQGWIQSNRGTGIGVFVGATFGLTVITVFSAVAWPLRMLAGSVPLIGKHLYEWKEPEPEGLLSCTMCASMWLGSILAAVGISAYPVHGALDLVAHGLFGAGTTWLLYAITDKLGVYNH